MHLKTAWIQHEKKKQTNHEFSNHYFILVMQKVKETGLGWCDNETHGDTYGHQN